jgi:hypothetical protein
MEFGKNLLIFSADVKDVYDFIGKSLIGEKEDLGADSFSKKLVEYSQDLQGYYKIDHNLDYVKLVSLGKISTENALVSKIAYPDSWREFSFLTEKGYTLLNVEKSGKGEKELWVVEKTEGDSIFVEHFLGLEQMGLNSHK